MKPLQVTDLSAEARQELDTLYRTTKDVRIHTRALIILLATEKGLVAEEIASIVRTDEQTVRRWLKRYLNQGIAGLSDLPRPGGPRKVTPAFLAALVAAARTQPQTLRLPFTAWTYERLADYLAQQTGTTIHPETIRLHLRAAGITLQQG